MPATQQADAFISHGHHIGLDAVQRGKAFGIVPSVAGAFKFAVLGYKLIAGDTKTRTGPIKDCCPYIAHISRRIISAKVRGELSRNAERKIHRNHRRLS